MDDKPQDFSKHTLMGMTAALGNSSNSGTRPSDQLDSFNLTLGSQRHKHQTVLAQINHQPAGQELMINENLSNVGSSTVRSKDSSNYSRQNPLTASSKFMSIKTIKLPLDKL